MLILGHMEGLSEWQATLMDGVLLTGILSPVLYHFLFKPLKIHMQEQETSRKTLQAVMDELNRKNKELDSKNAKLVELNKTLTDMVTIDGLTGIPNRRRFDEYLIQEWNRALRDKTPLSLIVIDIDFFKQYNDNYGHTAGDKCLKKVARALADTMVRSIDLVARYGGEEFICILPNTDAAGLVRVGNNLRDSINALAIPHAYSKVASHITISLGGDTLVPSLEMVPFLLVGQADARLYRAKETGRNRLVSE
ncbi:MAG: diguanylate cyclase [Magnetococcales bacterium]|nr:diguanylate cyclase [Magnetococcales bacterium]